MGRLRLCGLALVAAAALVSPASSATRATSNVDLAGTSFTPTPVMVQVNDTVHWIWQDGTHSTTSGTCTVSTCTPDGKWDSGISGVMGHTYDHSATFTVAGTYHYFCSVHLTAMQGNVIVNNPSSVTFTSFSARRVHGGVAVSWTTASEADVLGYKVYRQQGTRRIAVGNLIVAHGITRSAAYRFVDGAARVTPQLRYLLQVVHANGSRTWFGTVGVKG